MRHFKRWLSLWGVVTISFLLCGSRSFADELVICDGVFTNRSCMPSSGFALSSEGAMEKPQQPASEQERKDFSVPARESLQPQVASRAESLALLADGELELTKGDEVGGETSVDRARRVGGRRAPRAPSRDEARAQKSSGKGSDQSLKQRNHHHLTKDSSDVQSRTKATLVKALRAQQAECRLPECLPALALEEAIERCSSLEVNYSSCRQEAAMVLGKVAKAREQQRRAQFDEDRHRLELERLRQRGIKLSLDEARQRRGDGRRTKAQGD